VKFNAILNNFTSGEWSPKMYGRSETDQFFRAARELLNAIPMIQGGAFKRPGTEIQNLSLNTFTVGGHTFTGKSSLNNDTSASFRIFPFRYSSGDRHILVITEWQTDAGGLPNGSPWFIVKEPSQFGAGGIYPITASSSYSKASFSDLSKVDVKQFGDSLLLIDGAGLVAPRWITLSAGPVYTIKMHYEMYSGYEWLTFPFDTLTTYGSGGPAIIATGTFSVGGSVTLSSVKAVFDSSMVPSSNGGKGTLFRFTTGGNTGVVEIQTVFGGGLNATATVLTTLPGSSPQPYGNTAGTAWDRAAWGGGRGWPRTACGYQGRLYLGGTPGLPDTLWGSRISNVFWFQEIPFAQESYYATYADDNSRAWSFVPNSTEVSNIEAISSSKMLVVNTNRHEVTMYGSGGALGPNDVNAESSTFFGAESVVPRRVGNFLTFVQRGGRKLRDLIFSFDEYQYKSNDLSFTADHFTASDRIVSMVSAEIGSSILLCKTNTGKLLSLTLDRDYQVNAWAKQSIGGTGHTGGGILGEETDYAFVIDLGVIPGGSGSSDEVYLLLRRRIGGTDTISLEKLGSVYEGTSYDATTDAYTYLDGAINQDITQLGGFPATHYTFPYSDNIWKSREVSVVADNVYIGELTCNADGSIDLPREATKVVIGQMYTMRVTPMSVEQGAQYGSPVGKSRRIHDIFVRFFNTVSCSYGVSGDLYEIPFREDTVPLGSPTPPFSGAKYLKFPQGYSRDYAITFEDTSPHPCNILAVSMSGVNYDE